MLRIVLIILLIFNISVAEVAAETVRNKKFLMPYPYETGVNKKNIGSVVGVPLPKPDVQDTKKIGSDGDDYLDLLIGDYFLSPSLDALAMMPCTVTPVLAKPLKGERYNNITSNNLRRKTGSPDVAFGHIIYIKGFLRDINCHPIANADITIWQANAYGVYNADAKFTDQYDPYFQNAGFTITGTDGSFEFITILPGSIDDLAPTINFHIAIPKKMAFETQIFFQDHQLNNSDIRLKKLPEPVKSLLISGIAPINQDNIDEGFYMVVDLVANVINN